MTDIIARLEKEAMEKRERILGAEIAAKVVKEAKLKQNAQNLAYYFRIKRHSQERIQSFDAYRIYHLLYSFAESEYSWTQRLWPHYSSWGKHWQNGMAGYDIIDAAEFDKSLQDDTLDIPAMTNAFETALGELAEIAQENDPEQAADLKKKCASIIERISKNNKVFCDTPCSDSTYVGSYYSLHEQMLHYDRNRVGIEFHTKLAAQDEKDWIAEIGPSYGSIFAAFKKERDDRHKAVLAKIKNIDPIWRCD